MNNTPLVSCVMCTYGRHTVVNAAIAMFLKQDYPNKELIIWNTAPVELTLSDELKAIGSITLRAIKLVNHQHYLKTGKLYTSIGQIREDALKAANGDIYNCFDDDDLYFPWHISQGVKGLLDSGKQAWKPKKSLYSGVVNDGVRHFEPCENYLEATVFVYIDALKRFGFKHESGSEHLGWFEGLTKEGQLVEDANALPAYCFLWANPLAGHKQSGDLKNPNNFENHKAASTDFGDGRPLTGEYDLEQYWSRIRQQFPELPL